MRARAWLFTIVALLLPANLWFVWQRLRDASSAAAPRSARVIHGSIPLPPATKLAIGRGPSFAFSPDGTQIVCVVESQGKIQLYLRSLARDMWAPVAGTENAANPFFSPDGRWIAFFEGDNLKKVPAGGGAAVAVADAPSPRGESWTVNDWIALTPRDNTGLWRVAALGGPLEPLTTLAEGDASHRWPQVLPNGSHVMFTIWGGTWEPAQVAVQPMGGRPAARRVIVKGGGFARYVPGATANQGHVLFARPDALLAMPFDVSRLEATGEPVSIVEGVVTNFSGAAQFAVSSSGVLAYLAAQADPVERALAWVDRSGKPQPATTLRGLGRWYDLSPDGTRVARYNSEGTTRDVYVEDLAARTSTRVSFRGDASTSGPSDRLNAVWSVDGKRIAYAGGTPLNLFLSAADGSGGDERLTTSGNVQWPASWSPDGRTLAFVEMDPLSSSDIWLLALDENGKPRGVQPFLRTPFNESAPMISPDGRWLAYQSNESGRYEVYVQPFPGGGQRVQVSKDNGVYPRWSPKGDELFFRSGSSRIGLTAAPVKGESDFVVGPPRVLFELRGYESIFEVSPDASRFLMMPAVVRESATTQINIIVNWLAALR